MAQHDYVRMMNPDCLCEAGTAAPNASLYEEEHLAKTYIVEDSQTHDNLAYFSLLFDKIERSIAGPAIWNKLSRKIPNAKRRSSYPALKIGRLDKYNNHLSETQYHLFRKQMA